MPHPWGYLDFGTKLRFNITAGFTGTVYVTVGGATVEYTASDGLLGENAYVELDIPAYMLTETVTVTVGESAGTYDLAAYVKALQGTQYENLVSALYAYAASAKLCRESAE